MDEVPADGGVGDGAKRPPPGEVTRLLAAAGGGDEEASDRVFSLVYGELRGLAAAAMSGQPGDHTLQPTALIHEAYLKLTGAADGAFNDRVHFLSAASRAMRQILVDHARARRALKRGGGTLHLSLHEELDGAVSAEEEVLAVHDALERLATIDPAKSRVVELRFFGCLGVQETAQVMDVSPRTVKRLWRHARAWLFREISA